jgi:hypothetical protein
MPEPLLSLCLIVRDEQDQLPDCLASAAALVDEIVVVDTGSQDATPRIASAAGARVASIAWHEDFAAARNACISHATGRWMLFLDADERLQPVEAGPFREWLSRHEALALSIEIESPLGAGRVEVAPVVRLIRRRPDLRFEGRVHESVVPSVARALGTERFTPQASGLRVTHLGYLPERRAARGKDERNRRLLEQAIAAAPDDPGPRWLLVRERVPRIDGDLLTSHESATLLQLITPAAQRLAGESLQGVTEPLLADAARLALACGATDCAREWLDHLERLCGATARLCYARGELELQRAVRAQQPAEAATRWFVRTEHAPEGSEALRTEPAMRSTWLRSRIAAARLVGAAREVDEQELRQLTAGATEVEQRLVLAAASLQADRAGPAIIVLGEAVRLAPHDPRGWWALTCALRRVGESQKAAAMLATARKAAPGWVEAGPPNCGLAALFD